MSQYERRVVGWIAVIMLTVVGVMVTTHHVNHHVPTAEESKGSI